MSELKITIENAKKAYDSGCPDVKKVLENLFGAKAFRPKDVTQEINDIKDIYKKLGVNPDNDTIKVDGFDEGQLKVVKALIAKMRICEVYNGAKKLNRGDKRWYHWFRLSSSGSGLVFGSSLYNGGDAYTSSASRLSFREEKFLKDFLSKFQNIDEDIIDLR